MSRHHENVHEIAADRHATMTALATAPRENGVRTRPADSGATEFRRIRPRDGRSTCDEAEERRARLSMGAFLTAC